MITPTKLHSINITWSPTASAFITSNADIVALIGPKGEGKTTAGAGALFHWGPKFKAQHGRKMPCAIIRDTHINIKRMTKKSMEKSFPFALRFYDSDLKCESEWFEIDLIGIDGPGALNKIQGSEYAFIWLEEPAPIVDAANAGLPLWVYEEALKIVARGGHGFGRLQITMNPADEYHWTFDELVENPRFPHPTYPDIHLEVFNIPFGENKHLAAKARALTDIATMHDPGQRARYVEGKFAFVQLGEAVTPEYNEDIHRAKHDLMPIPGALGFRFWDGGLNPTCLVGQVTPAGGLWFIDSKVGENIGMTQLVEGIIIPLMEDKYSKVTRWRDIGDPSLKDVSTTDSETSPAAIIESRLKTIFEPGPIPWGPRREAWKVALNRMVGGYPYVMLSQGERVLNRCLRGGWHYRKDNSGRIIRENAVKDIHSHPGDAGGYGLSRLLGMLAQQERQRQRQAVQRSRGSAVNRYRMGVRK